VRVAVLHSALSASERLEHWLAAAKGDAQLVVGTRLAVFAPLPQLGLIVVDEEHDVSFKQTGRRALPRARRCDLSRTTACRADHHGQRDAGPGELRRGAPWALPIAYAPAPGERASDHARSEARSQSEP